MTTSECFTRVTRGGVPLLTAPNITAPHGFTTREGGVSQGIFASLNLAENRGDDPERVRENYRRLKSALGLRRLCFTKQVHGNEARYVTSADAREPYEPCEYTCDGLVTDEPGLGLLVFTADCIPILLHDPAGRVIAAAHAGWRGTVADIAGAAVAAMARLGSDPADIRAAIGPGISQCCFETNDDVPKAVLAVLGGEGHAFISAGKVPGKYYVDLKGVNRALLLRAGLRAEHIAVSDACTLCRPDLFWSHRATGGQRGSQASVIALPDGEAAV